MQIAWISDAPLTLRLLTGRRLSADGLRRAQSKRLRRVVLYAWSQIPFYRSRFEAAGVGPKDIKGIEDLDRLPLVSRTDLQAADPHDLRAASANRDNLIEVRTSGSTGEPLTVYLSQADLRARAAVEQRSLMAAGFRPRDRLAVLGTNHQQPRRFHQSLGLYRGEVIPAHSSLDAQVRRLREIDPTVFWVYPSHYRALREHVGADLRSVLRPRMVITSAEPLDELLRAQIEEDLGVPTYDFYGSIEAGRIASECRCHSGLHVNADHVVLELVRDLDLPRPTVVITTLNCRTMPFIRYRLGDATQFIAGVCKCGCELPRIHAPEGRDWDLIRLPSGRLLPPLVVSARLQSIRGLDRFRIVQESLDRLTVEVSFRASTPRSLNNLRVALLEALPEEMLVEVRETDLRNEGSQKFRSFVSRLP